MRTPLPTGTVMAGFRVERLVGEGATGAVYLAFATERRERVALKVLSPELAQDERFRQRFLRESQLAASLHHPHIVRTLASGEEQGQLYLAMAYVEGQDLRQLLRQEGRLQPERALELLAQVAEALDAAHGRGLVHRDVKPGNILLSGQREAEQAYLCDFGLARHVTSVSSLTGERGFVGTIDYVPPEQIEGATIDSRADVYSLGCVLYECLAGQRPFERESELSVVFAHLNEPPPKLSEIRPELPQEFDEVFATALAKAPSERYGSCGELFQAARAAAKGKTFVRTAVRRRRALMAVAVLAAAAAAAVGGVLASRGSHGSSGLAVRGKPISLQPNALNLIDARTQRITARIPGSKRAAFASGVWGLAFMPETAWVLVGPKQRVVRVDLERHKVTGTVQLPWLPGGITSGGGSIWVAQDVGPEVARIDARTGRLAGRFRVSGAGGANADGIAYGAGSLWLARQGGVLRVDPTSGGVTRRFAAPSRYVVFADGFVWAATEGGRVWKIDPIENTIVTHAQLQGFVSDLTVGGGYVWASVIPGDVVFKLGEDDLGVQVSPSAGADPERLSYGGGRLWIANTAARTISLLDQVSGRRQQLVAQAGPTTAVYHDGVVWAMAEPAPTPLPPIQGEELRISTPTGGVETDPRGTGPSGEQLLYATCARLLDYPDSAGAAGTRLRPEVAAALPTVSKGGRTYTFRIRPGFRFSPPSNEPVTAQTFKHTIERVLADKHAWPFPPAIVGAGVFRQGKAAHVSGISARGNMLSITLVRPDGDFPTRISMPSFCPVPLSVPLRGDPGPAPLPSAGPYYVSSIEGDRAVLLRNPNYHGDRPRRPERIVFTNDIPTPKAVALADAGAVDLLPQDFDNTTSLLQVGSPLQGRYGPGSAAARAGDQRFFLYPAPFLDYIAFNTRRPLFRDGRLRRAVNDALDRPVLAHAYGDVPDDQIVPLSVPGFPAGRIFPVGRPDLRAARRLAGAPGRPAVIYACGDPRLLELSRLVRSNLAPIGIRVSILQSDNCSDDDAKRADLSFGTWGLGPADRDPAPFIDMAIGGAYGWQRPGPGPWNDPGFRRRIERARTLLGRARLDAFRRVDDQLTRMAPYAVFGSWVWAEYLSPKAGCRVFQGFYGFVDLGALCKKS